MLVDPFDEHDVAQAAARYAFVMRLIQPYADKEVARLFKGPHASAASHIKPDSVAFLYLDASRHDYASVARDLRLFWPKIMPGGVLAGHDYTVAHSGTAIAVNEFARAGGLTLLLTRVQAPRVDVLGNRIPPCCPSWMVRKPAG